MTGQNNVFDSESLFAAISEIATRSASPAAGLAKAANLIAERTGADAVQLSALISGGDRVIEIFSSGNLTNLFPSGLRRPAPGTALYTVSKRGALLYSKENMLESVNHGVEDFSVYMAAGYSYLAASPVYLHSNVLGAIQLLSSRPFSSEDIADVLRKSALVLAPYMGLYLAKIESAVEDRITLSMERVAEAVIQENSIAGVCDAVVRFAQNSMGIDAAVLRVTDEYSDQLNVEYKYGHLDPEQMAGDSFSLIEEVLIPLAVERSGPMIIDEGSPEVFDDSDLLKLLEDLPSMLITPLMDKDELIGTLEFYSLNEYAYKTDNLRNLEHVANLLTSAVEQIRLIRSLSREARIRSFLAEVARLASAAHDLTTLADNIAPELQNIIPVENIAYFIPPEHYHQGNPDEGGSGTCESYDDPPGPFVQSVNAHSGLSRIVVMTPGIDMCPESANAEGSSPVCESAYCTAAPLWDDADGNPRGWIHLERSDTAFSGEEQTLVAEFARHIAPAIDTVLSHESELKLTQEQLRAERAEAEARHQRQLNDAKEAFITTMSHELRTPLTAIRAFADILHMDAENLSDRQSRQVSVVRRNTEWLNILINDMLDLSSMDSGRFELRFRDSDVSSLIEDLVESFGPIAESAGHNLSTILPSRPIHAAIDPNRISQVIGNLLTNAFKYSPEGTPIRLLVRPKGQGVYVYIRDEGHGIPRRQQADVFKRFVRAKSEASKMARGTGIGLYVSRMIVEAHGGRIGVTSKLKSHTTMHFWLPRRQPESTRAFPVNKDQSAA